MAFAWGWTSPSCCSTSLQQSARGRGRVSWVSCEHKWKKNYEMIENRLNITCSSCCRLWKQIPTSFRRAVLACMKHLTLLNILMITDRFFLFFRSLGSDVRRRHWHTYREKFSWMRTGESKREWVAYTNAPVSPPSWSSMGTRTFLSCHCYLWVNNVYSRF